MSDLCEWWNSRKQQFQALLVLVIILLWMSLNLRQTDRNFRAAMRAHERLVKELEAAREIQLDGLMQTSEGHMARQDLDVKSIRDDLRELQLKITALIEKTVGGE